MQTKFHPHPKFHFRCLFIPFQSLFTQLVKMIIGIQISNLVCIIITVISVFLDKTPGTWKWQEPAVIRYTYHRHIHHLLDAFCHTYFHAQLHNNPLFLPLVYHMVQVAVPSFFVVAHRILGFHFYYFWRSQYIWIKKDLQCMHVRIQVCDVWKNIVTNC